MRTANPVLRIAAFDRVPAREPLPDTAGVTLHGTLWKSALLAALMLVSSAYPWIREADRPLSSEAYAAGAIGVGMVFAVLTYLHHRWAYFTGPIVAVCLGLGIGGMSAYLERATDGGFFGLALLGAMVTFPVTLWLYHVGAVAPTDRVRVVLNATAGAVFVLYLATVAIEPLPLDLPVLYQTGLAGVACCALFAAVAALNLALDLEVVTVGATDDREAARHLEWYGAFALLVSLVWMYPETVRQLARMHARLRGAGAEAGEQSTG